MPQNNSNDTPPRSPEASESDAMNDNALPEMMFLGEGGNADHINMDDVIEIDEDEEDEDWPVPPERDDAVVQFAKHLEPVLACAFHPSKSNVAVTGSMDNTVAMWEFIPQSDNTMEVVTLSEFKLGQESVDCVKFSKDGKYLATVDLDSNINIFKGDTFEHIKHIELNDEFVWLEWHPEANVFVICTHQYLIMYSVPKFEEKYISTTPQSNSYGYGRILFDGKRVAVFTACGTMRIYDMKTTVAVTTVKPFQELEVITKMDVHKDHNAILCGCGNGFIFVVNPDTGKCVPFPSPKDETECVEALAYAKAGNALALAASGHGNGTLRIWESTRQVLRLELKLEGGVTDMQWHPTELIVFSCLTNGIVSMVNALSGAELMQFTGHTQQCLSLDLNLNSSLGPVLMTTSDDNTARVYRIPNNS